MSFCAEELAFYDRKWRESFREPAPQRCGVCRIYVFFSVIQAAQWNGRYQPHVNHDCDGLCNGCATGNSVFYRMDLEDAKEVMLYEV